MQKYIKKRLLQIVIYLDKMLILFLFLNLVKYNYHFIYKDILASYIKVATIVYNLLYILLY